jgi:hypothetical protein
MFLEVVNQLQEKTSIYAILSIIQPELGNIIYVSLPASHPAYKRGQGISSISGGIVHFYQWKGSGISTK